MMTVEKTKNGMIILGVFKVGYGWEFIPCANDDELNIELYKRGAFAENENTPIWKAAYQHQTIEQERAFWLG